MRPEEIVLRFEGRKRLQFRAGPHWWGTDLTELSVDITNPLGGRKLRRARYSYG